MRSALSSGKKLMSRGNYRPLIRETSFRFFSASSYTKVSSETLPTESLAAVPVLPPHSYTDLIEGINQIESKTEFDYSPTHLVMQAVEQIHLFAGIPYWEAIIISTLALRVLLVPSAIVVVRDVSKMRALQPEIKRIKESFAGVSAADDPTIRFKYGAEVTKLFKANNVNPLRSAAISFLQLPIFLSLFFGLRNMGTFYPEYSSGGDLWFTDLSAADPYFILPTINALSFLLMIELGSEGPQTEQQKMLKMTMRGLAVAVGPLTYMVPQGVFVYWITNNFFSLAQTLTLKDATVREYCGLAPPPSISMNSGDIETIANSVDISSKSHDSKIITGTSDNNTQSPDKIVETSETIPKSDIIEKTVEITANLKS